jgi:hypothetical protein
MIRGTLVIVYVLSMDTVLCSRLLAEEIGTIDGDVPGPSLHRLLTTGLSTSTPRHI